MSESGLNDCGPQKLVGCMYICIYIRIYMCIYIHRLRYVFFSFFNMFIAQECRGGYLKLNLLRFFTSVNCVMNESVGKV